MKNIPAWYTSYILIYTWWNTTNFEYFGYHKTQQERKIKPTKSMPHMIFQMASIFFRFLLVHRDANDQKFSRKDGNAVNQLMKAIPVAVSNSIQWFCSQSPRSLSIRTVMPADAQAAAKVRVDVICNQKRHGCDIRYIVAKSYLHKLLT